MTQLISGMSTPRPITSVHTRMPLKLKRTWHYLTLISASYYQRVSFRKHARKNPGENWLTKVHLENHHYNGVCVYKLINYCIYKKYYFSFITYNYFSLTVIFFPGEPESAISLQCHPPPVPEDNLWKLVECGYFLGLDVLPVTYPQQCRSTEQNTKH